MPSRRPSGLAPGLLLALVILAGACDASDPSSVPPSVQRSDVPSMSADTDATREPPTPSTPAMPSTTPARPPSPPAGDPYDVPDPLPAGSPGDLVAVERVAAPDGAVAWRVLYRSETIAGRPIAVTGLIAAPDAQPPPGGFPVLAWAHGSSGLADTCAPSLAARPLSEATDGRGSLPLPPLWEAGYVVAATDYEGLGTPGRHPYLVGGSEARSVLDAIRAAQRLPEAWAGTSAVVLGISQGGHAALFTAEVAPSYAPELHLRGAVALAPATELAQAAMALAFDPTAVGFAVAIGAGFEAAYPEADLASVLTPDARSRLGIVDEGCLDDVLAAFQRPAAEVLRLEALLEPPWPRLMVENTPGQRRSDVPVFIGQGSADALVVPELTDALVARLEALGTPVTYRRYPGASHGGVLDASWADVRVWLDARLAD
jgi:dienelactone hydrolase